MLIFYVFQQQRKTLFHRISAMLFVLRGGAGRASRLRANAHRLRDCQVSYRAIFATYCALFVAYSINVYTSGTDAPHVNPMSAQGRHGQLLFQEHNCVACHQFYGLGGYMGPDLTNVISNRGPAVARAFMASGTRAMPNFNLTDEELDALVAFLEFVDQTGTYPVEDFDITWFGTVAQTDDPR